ncbi:MAG: hypothetical protein WC643_00385 [Parcubacteria group bacterium]|jgi:hypothetical protein
MKKNKKIAVASILALSLVFPFSAWAYVVGSFPYIGTVSINVNEILQEVNETGISSVASQMENRYGVNQDAWRTAKRKETAPRMELFFDNTNPKAGEKVTVHAVPEFFKNDPQNLYYTWYIVHKRECKDGNGYCDSNGKLISNEDEVINKGKLEAAGILARGDYDPDLDGQSYSDPEKDPDKDGWPAIDNSYDASKTAAPMGGSDGVGGLSEESVSAFNTSDEWCDSLGDHTSDKCSFNDENSSKPFDTYFTLKSSQTNHYCDLCKNYFSEGEASSYANAKTARNNCCYTNTPESSLQCSSIDPVTLEETFFKCAQVSGTDYCGTTYNSLFDGCYDNFKESNKSTTGTCLSAEYASCKNDWATVHEDYNGDGFSDYNEEDTTQVSRCYKHNFGTNADAPTFRENELSSSATDDPSGLDFSVACKHKWINPPDYTSGSGKFPTGEEKYWKTDPADPDTDGDGFVDGADVIGLGQQDFTWTYQTGDRVGVVAEGTSMIPTDEKNAYYKIMWGYPDICDSTKTGLLDKDQCDGSDDYNYGFLATESPNESGDEKLKVSLSSSPENPVADPSDENAANISSDGSISDADKITVTSSLDNTNLDPSTLYYTWQIQKGTVGDESSWEELSIKDYFDTTAGSSGLGLSSFSFTPKTDALAGDDDTVNFKVTLTIAKSSGTETGRGRSSVTIPINKKGIQLKLYKVNVESGKATLGEEICKDGLYKTLCPVVKGQLVAAEISSSSYTSSNNDFSWSIEETAYPVPTGLSDSFDGWSDTKIYFPITQSEQETPSITVTATPKDSLQPVTSTRLLTVVNPAAFIKSSDTSSSWNKVSIDEDGQVSESPGFFETFVNTGVSYNLEFVPRYLLSSDSNTVIDWQIDNVSIDSEDFSEYDLGLSDVTTENNTQTIKFTTGSTEGAYHTLGVNVKKTWTDDEKKLLSSTWGITPDSLSGDSSVSIETLNEDLVGSANNPNQILAAIGTHLPHYFMYLLRLVLTLVVMFIVSAGFYGVTQRLSLSNEEK